MTLNGKSEGQGRNITNDRSILTNSYNVELHAKNDTLVRRKAQVKLCAYIVFNATTLGKPQIKLFFSGPSLVSIGTYF